MVKLDKVVKAVVRTGVKLAIVGVGAKVVFKLGECWGVFKETAHLCYDDALFDSVSNLRDSFKTLGEAVIKKEGENINAECNKSAESASEETAKEA